VLRDLPTLAWFLFCVVLPGGLAILCWLVGEKMRPRWLGGFVQYWGTPFAFSAGIVLVAHLYVQTKGI
jgi:hypothetical protein